MLGWPADSSADHELSSRSSLAFKTRIWFFLVTVPRLEGYFACSEHLYQKYSFLVAIVYAEREEN